MLDAAHASFVPPGVAVVDAACVRPIGLERVIQELDQGLLLVDERARILFANRSARRNLFTGQALVLEGDAVMPAVPSHRGAWQKALSSMPPGDGMLFDLSSGVAPLHVTLNALGPLSGSAAAHCVIAIGIAPSCVAQSGRIGAFASHYRLTRAEVRVLAQLLDDHAPQQIARRLDISMSTVRTHLKHILHKTSASSLRQLTALVLRMPVGFWDRP